MLEMRREMMFHRRFLGVVLVYHWQSVGLYSYHCRPRRCRCFCVYCADFGSVATDCCRSSCSQVARLLEPTRKASLLG